MLLRRVSRSAASRPLRAGFTLAELLAVVAILAILAGVAIPSYMAIVSSSRVRIAKSETKSLAGNLKNFAMQHIDDANYQQGYPDPSSGFGALVQEGMLTELPKDPWGALYYWELVQNPNSGTLEPVVYSSGSGGVISSIDQ
jgi:prepilin-type N-terminal cleavage/methylation domain-containing protein